MIASFLILALPALAGSGTSPGADIDAVREDPGADIDYVGLAMGCLGTSQAFAAALAHQAPADALAALTAQQCAAARDYLPAGIVFDAGDGLVHTYSDFTGNLRLEATFPGFDQTVVVDGPPHGVFVAVGLPGVPATQAITQVAWPYPLDVAAVTGTVEAFDVTGPLGHVVIY